MDRNPSPRREDLVEPEGVNAGSAESTAESPETGGGDVVDGGHPERAADQVEESEAPDAAEIVDAPFGRRDPDAPSLEQSVEEGAAGPR